MNNAHNKNTVEDENEEVEENDDEMRLKNVCKRNKIIIQRKY